MQSRLTAAMAAVLALAPLAPAAAGEGAGDAQEAVPVTDVVLYSSGVGYFGRSGSVKGDASVDLRFKTEQINDILKSLVVLDTGGGQVSAVGYAAQDPTGKALKAFGLDLAGNPSMADLLVQLRGVEISAATPEGKLEGSVLGVESQTRRTKDGDVITLEFLNLATGSGIKSFPLAEIRDIQILDANLKDEMKKALEVLAKSRDRQKRTVSIRFAGKGEREVKITYVLEAPVWKTSYRLLLADKPKDKSALHGWAIVENTTDSDWKNVNLSLVSGRPISFIQDLYTPLYLDRPVVTPQLFAGLRPRQYEEAMDWDGKADKLAEHEAAANEMAMGRRKAEAGKAGAYAPAAPATAAPGGYGGGGRGRQTGALADIPANRLLNLAGASLGAAASGKEAGELFRYSVKAPVTIARQSSAMLPIVAGTAEGEKLSVFNANAHPRHPYSAFKLKNSTGLALLSGPVTVFDGGTYAGDAELPNLQPGEERLLSYGLDLACTVEPRSEGRPQQLVSAKIANGVLYLQHRSFQETLYTIKNKKDAKKTVLVEHPYNAGWELVEPKKAEERTDSFYRFQASVPADDKAELKVVTQRIDGQTMALINMDVDRIGMYVSGKELPRKVKDALAKAAEMKRGLNDLNRKVAELERQKSELYAEQGRLRDNLKSVPQTSEVYARYLKKMNDQETEIEKLQGQIAEARDAARARQKEVNDFIANLDAE